MNDTPVSKVLQALYATTGYQPRREGKGWKALCPCHDDHNPSVSVNEEPDGRVLIHCFVGCRNENIVKAIELTLHDLFPVSTSTGTKTPSQVCPKGGFGDAGDTRKTYPTADDAIKELERKFGKRSADWTYTDSNSEPVGMVIRWDKHDGKVIRPVSLNNGDDWVIGGMPVPRPLYRLADLGKAKRVYINEGEKVVDALRSLGLIATTSPHGSKSANKADWTPLAGKEVVIQPDHDNPGARYRDEVIAILSKLTPAPVIKVVDLPDLPPGGDAYDYIKARREAGASDDTIRDEIEAMADAAEPIQPNRSRALPGTRRANIVCLADVQPEPLQWLWPGRIALGKLTVIAGDPGLGKSFVTLDIASRISTGVGWPDCPGQGFEPGGVVLLSAEDDVADTIRPRLDAAGAEVSRIVALQSIRSTDPKTGGEFDTMFSLATDLPALEEAIQRTASCRLVVIDPITAYLGGTDSHKNAEIRGLLAPLADLAAKHRVALVAVTHLNKNPSAPAIYRTMGSLAFAAAARAVWGVTKDKEDPQRRLFLPVKNNIAMDTTGLAYSLKPTGLGSTPAVTWESDPVSLTADEAMSPDRGGNEQHSERDDAATWLHEALADGPIESGKLQEMAKQAGHKWGTVIRAKGDIGVESVKEGFGESGIWRWHLPDQRCAPASTPETVRTLADGAHLRAGAIKNEGKPPIKGAHDSKGAQPPGMSTLGDEDDDWGEV